MHVSVGYVRTCFYPLEFILPPSKFVVSQLHEVHVLSSDHYFSTNKGDYISLDNPD